MYYIDHENEQSSNIQYFLTSKNVVSATCHLGSSMLQYKVVNMKLKNILIISSLLIVCLIVMALENLFCPKSRVNRGNGSFIEINSI